MNSISRDKFILYAKYPFPYSDHTVEAMLLRTGRIKDVADIGAGTGLLTRHFVDRCRNVYAIGPDTEMRRIAEEEFGGDKVVTMINGSA